MTIGSYSGMIALARQRPEILSIPGLAGFASAARLSMHRQSRTMCPKCAVVPSAGDSQVYQQSLANLGEADLAALKRLLGASKIGYYQNQSGKLVLTER